MSINKMKTILLAGFSASGKSTLALHMGRKVFSTSQALRDRPEVTGAEETVDNDFLFRLGEKLDAETPHWLEEAAIEVTGHGVVVDAVRSENQLTMWSANSGWGGIVTVNVVCSEKELERRHKARGTTLPKYKPFLFENPDFVWRSDEVPVVNAMQAIRYMSGGGHVDVVLGAQYGSEGKGKLCSLLAGSYDLLVRSGGPNAGHWVRDEKGASGWSGEYCYHSLPSGTMSNPRAGIMVAAGAAISPEKFHQEVMDTGCAERLMVDNNTMLIAPSDLSLEANMVAGIGSTAQGVGEAQKRRIGRHKPPLHIRSFEPFYGSVSSTLQEHLGQGAKVMLEGTQGSGLSLYHGPYPFVTSRDTNAAGLLSEVGVPSTWMRDVWLVVRSLPIRTGGNSGPMYRELSWDQVAERLGEDGKVLREKERTSTTKRIRRVGEFDAGQFRTACQMNSPTKLFLTFADYINPEAKGVKEWAKLPMEVVAFTNLLAGIANCPVVGVSTGPDNADVAWRPGYEP